MDLFQTSLHETRFLAAISPPDSAVQKLPDLERREGLETLPEGPGVEHSNSVPRVD